jgi:type IV pilus assembly protein PilM
MFTAGKSIVGLDIGSTAIKAVELTKSGKSVTVTGFGQLDISAQDPQAIAGGIAELMREGGFRTKHVVTNVSGQKVIVRYLQMAPMTDEELRNAIIFEAEKYIPFTLDECVMDCQRLADAGGAEGSAGSNVVLVAVTKNQIDDQLKLLQGAGVVPEIVDVDAFALSNAFGLLRTYVQPEGGQDGVVALVDIGATKTCLNILADGVSAFTREIYIGGKDLTQQVARRLEVQENEAEALKRSPNDNMDAIKDAVFPTIDDLGNELQLSFDYFENQYSKGIDKIMLSGGSARFGLIRETMEKIFEKPTAIFNPFEGLPLSEEIDQDLLASSGPQLVVATGLASRILKG